MDDHEPWFARWREGRIGFHEGKPNAMLARHVARLGGRRRVLVPLCGKTEDLAFLAAHGHEVVGLELVEDAVRAFFAEHGLAPEVSRAGAHARYAAGAITVVAGDAFTAPPELIGPADALYDRAALIALPPDRRGPYVAAMRARIAPGSPGIVITLEYPPHQHPGPPFSVDEAELRSRFPGGALELLDEAVPDRVPVAGMTAVERCWAVTT